MGVMGRGKYLVVLAGVLFIAACYGEKSGASSHVPTDTAAAMPLPGMSVPDSLAPGAAPTGSTTVVPAVPVILHRADSVAGDAIYHGRGRCFTCHGGLGRGTAKLGPDLTDSIWLNGDSSFAAIREVIAFGVATPRQFPVAMPAYAGMLDDSALTHVAAYVYALSHHGALLSDSMHVNAAHPSDTAVPPQDSTHRPPTP